MKKLILTFIVSALILSNLQTPTVLGCALSFGDPWYSVKPEIVQNPLSDVLGISFSQSGTLITFTNRGLKSNLYIASKDTDGIYPGYRASSKDYRPVEKILGHNFEPNVQITTGGAGLPKDVYEFSGGWGAADIGQENDKNSGTLVLDRVLDRTDNYKTKQVVRDGRPKNVSIPKPDHQIMYAFYQGKRYDINIVLNYSLNNSYDSSTNDSCGDDFTVVEDASPEEDTSVGGYDGTRDGYIIITLAALSLSALTIGIWLLKQRNIRHK